MVAIDRDFADQAGTPLVDRAPRAGAGVDRATGQPCSGRFRDRGDRGPVVHHADDRRLAAFVGPGLQPLSAAVLLQRGLVPAVGAAAAGGAERTAGKAVAWPQILNKRQTPDNHGQDRRGGSKGWLTIRMNLSSSGPIPGMPPRDGRDPRGRSSTREQKANRQQEEGLAQHPFAVHMRSDQPKGQQCTQRAT